MAATTSIAVQESTKEALDKYREHERETYDDIVVKLIKLAKKGRQP
jgi:hypothetical protein